MKKEKVLYLMERLSLPVLLGLLGLVLLFSPDTASALVGKVAGVGLFVIGAVYLVEGLTTRVDMPRKLLISLVCLAGGSWLTAHPLTLAAWIGRLTGLFLLLRGLGSLVEAKKLGQKLTWSLVIALAGVLLLLSPMVTSRLMLKTFGLVLTIVGGVLIVIRLNQQKRLEGGRDPNIIDV